MVWKVSRVNLAVTCRRHCETTEFVPASHTQRSNIYIGRIANVCILTHDTNEVHGFLIKLFQVFLLIFCACIIIIRVILLLFL